VDLHLQPHWQDMLGLYVEIRLQGRTVRVGTVDAVMPDDSILWISAEGPYSRQMVARADGFEVFGPLRRERSPGTSSRGVQERTG
jgi:hypothetical protein